MKNKKFHTFECHKKDLRKFINLINHEIKKKNAKYNNDLSNLHKYVDKNDINSLRLKCFTKLNSINWKNIIKKVLLKNLTSLLGPDLLVQSKINLSIQVPNDKNSILSSHSDSWSSDTPFQLNCWLPLTNAFSTNSMFVLNKKITIKSFKSISNYDLLKKNKISKKDFIKLNFGNYVLFNPALLHGNVENKTNKTRVSLNLRFKSIFSPEPDQYHQDRKFGTYYQKFCISDNTKFALEVIDTEILK